MRYRTFVRSARRCAALAAACATTVSGSALAQWSAPVELGSVGVETPVVAVDGAGDATTLFQRPLADGAQLVATDTVAGAAGAGGSRVLATSTRTTPFGDMDLSVDASGAAVAVWTQYTDTNGPIGSSLDCTVHAATRGIEADAAWIVRDEPLDFGDGAIWGCDIDLEATADGTVSVVWATNDLATPRAYVGLARLADGTWTRRRVALDAQPNARKMTALIAPADAGTATIAWEQAALDLVGDSATAVHVATDDVTNGTFGGVRITPDETAAEGTLLDVAGNGEGAAVVVWSDNFYDGNAFTAARVHAMGIGADGARSVAHTFEDAYPGGPGTAAVVDSAGTATVAYLSVTQDNRLIAARRPIGGAWTSTDLGSIFQATQGLAVGPDDTVVATYTHGTSYALSARRYGNGSWLDTEQVTPDLDARMPAGLAVGAGGHVAVAYRTGPGAGEDLALARRAPELVPTPDPDPVNPGPTKPGPADPAPIGGTPQPPTVPAKPGLSTSFTVTDTSRTVGMPKLLGLRLDDARDRLRALKIQGDPTVVLRHASQPAGDVIASTPGAGVRLFSGVGSPARITLFVSAGPRAAAGAPCPVDALRGNLKGAELSVVLDVVRKAGCRLDDLQFASSKQASDVDVATLAPDGRKALDLRVTVPADPSRNDLFLNFREQTGGAVSFATGDWSLTARGRTRNAVVAQVIDRTGALVQGAVIYVDTSDVAGADDIAPRSTDRVGEAVLAFTPTRGGTVDVVVVARSRNGQAISGSARLTVADRSTAKVGSRITTVGGRTFQATAQSYVQVAAKARSRSDRARLIDFSAVGTFLQQALGGLFPQASQELKGPGTQQALLGIGRGLGLHPAQLASSPLPIGARAGLPRLVGGQVVAAGGANVVAAGGANAVAAGGANVVAAGGANAITAAGAGVVAAGGANVVAAGGANVVAPGGANVVAPGGANVVAAGGANLVVLPNGAQVLVGGGRASASVVAAGGANLFPQNAAGLISDNGLG